MERRVCIFTPPAHPKGRQRISTISFCGEFKNVYQKFTAIMSASTFSVCPGAYRRDAVAHNRYLLCMMGSTGGQSYDCVQSTTGTVPVPDTRYRFYVLRTVYLTAYVQIANSNPNPNPVQIATY